MKNPKIEKNLCIQANIAENDAIKSLEYSEFIILGINNGTLG